MAENEGQILVSQILQGLRHMHENGFAHRDLKPSNILVASKGPNWWVKIADFGISKRAMEGVTALRTQTGTPAFTAPEVLGFLQPDDSSHDSYTNAVDIWSLGVIAFLVLTGENLFKEQRFLGRYVSGSFAFPLESLSRNNVSVRGCELIRLMMAPRAGDRPEVRECLQHSWLRSLTDFPKNDRSESNSDKSSTISIGNSDSDPSASWSTQIPNPSHETPMYSHPHVGEPPTGNKRLLETGTVSIGRWKNSKTLRGHTQDHFVNTVAFSPNGKQLASGSSDSTIIIWDLATGTFENRLKSHQDWVSQVAFSPDGKYIASGSGDGTVKIWDALDGKLRSSYSVHERDVLAVTYSPGGESIASGSSDKTIKIWDSLTDKLKNTLEGHKESILAVAFSPGGTQIVSASDDETLKIWDSASGQLMKTLADHTGAIRSVAFSRDGRHFASGSYDTTIKLWDSTFLALITTLQGHKSYVVSVAFSPDGKLIASGSSATTIKLWNLATGSLSCTLKGHRDLVTSVAFSPDGKLIASGSYDRTIRLWGSDSPEEAKKGSLSTLLARVLK